MLAQEDNISRMDDVQPSRFRSEGTIKVCRSCEDTFAHFVTGDVQQQPVYCSECSHMDCTKLLVSIEKGRDARLAHIRNSMSPQRQEEPQVVSEDVDDADHKVPVAPVENYVKPIVQEKKIWTLSDLKLDPVFRSGGKFTIIKSLSLREHVLQPAGKEGYELVWKVWFTMYNYHLNVELEPLEELPEVDQVCFVDSSSGIQRAVTTGTYGVNNTVAVRYLDFGGLDCVNLEDCYHVCPKIMRDLPIIALQVWMPGHPFLFGTKKFAQYLPIFKLTEVEVDFKEEIDVITWKADLTRFNGQTLVQQMCSIEPSSKENWDEDV